MALGLIDNDVLLKTSAYGLLTLLLTTRPSCAETFAMLGAAKYVVPKRLKKRLSGAALETALHEFESAQALVAALEPTGEEVRLAAALEVLARKNDLELDAGESVLCAVLIYRGDALIFTGDKRAIVAIGGLTATGQYQVLVGKVVCLEQVFAWLVKESEGAKIQAAICAKQAVDKTLNICFGCYSGGTPIDSCIEGLASNIRDLAQKSRGVLIDADQLFKKTA
jgi:hypothetical protein